MEHNGWIKLHRKLLEKGYWNKSQYVHLWLHLLLSANHKPKEFMWNDRLIMVKEGQLITGRKELSKATGIPETTVERILNMLENEHQIGQQKTTKYRLITIVNWEEYQNRTSERTTSGQQADTNKNEKNEKKIVALEDEPREVLVSDSDEERPKKLPKDEKALSLCRWAEQRRGFVFTSIPAQLGAIGRAKTAGISPTRLKERWGELEGETWRNGFDWVDVVKSFDKRA